MFSSHSLIQNALVNNDDALVNDTKQSLNLEFAKSKKVSQDYLLNWILYMLCYACYVIVCYVMLCILYLKSIHKISLWKTSKYQLIDATLTPGDQTWCPTAVVTTTTYSDEVQATTTATTKNNRAQVWE